MVEAGKSTYQGKSESDLIEEKIDEVILRALGLDDVFDLDYGTYKTLLKERMMADRMGRKMDTSEVEAVTNEYKRVKNKTGRFRLNKKKVTASAFKVKKTGIKTAPITAASRILPGTTFAKLPALLKPTEVQQPGGEIVPSSPGALAKKSYTYDFKKIEGGLDEITKILKGSDNFEKEKEKKRKQEEGRKKKKDRESTLEKTVGAIAKIGKKILEPLKGPLDYIFNWIKWTFLGKVVHNLLNWMSDPANTKKMESIGRFMKDWWPALVGAYLIFGNSLGRFVSKLIFTVGAFTARMTLAAIPKLLKVIRSPLGMGAMLFGAGAAIPMLMPGTVDEQERKTDKAVGEKGEEKVRAELERKANKPNFFERLTGQDVEAKEQLYKMDTGQTKSYGFAKGGKVTTQSGTDIKGAGVDTQLIAARPGEVVINKPTVDALGAPFFLALNQKYGGPNANKPKLAKNVQSAAFGGMVLPAFANGGRVGSGEGGLRSDPVAELREHFNNFAKSRGAAVGFDIGDPGTWRGKTSPSGGGGSGGFLSGLGFLGRAAGQVPRVADNLVGSKLSYAQRAAGEAAKMASPTLSRAQRVAGEVQKRAGSILGGAQQRVKSVIDSVRNYDYGGLQTLGSNIQGAATEALPALLSSTIGLSRTDRGISQSMQKALLEARKNALAAGRKNIDYGDYAGGGLSAGGLTFGRIGDDEFKRDAQGRIIGIRQIYDTNRSARDAMRQAGESFEAFKKSGFRDMGSLGRAAYKPFEAWLAKVQNRGMTMHDVNFDEKVLGFKPGQEVLNPTQKRMIAEQKNREALQNKRPWWDKMGLFGGATAEMQRQQKNKPVYGPGGSASGSGKGQAQQKPPQQLNKAQQIYGAKTPVITKTKPPQRAWYDPRGWVGKQGGGITESTGMNIPGAAADRQLIAAQPGEYVLPVDAVMRLGGVKTLDQLVATLDPNSTPAKMGARNLKPIPGPPMAGRSGMMTLPPITSGASSGGGGSGKGERKQVPSFSATSPYSGERQNNADIYGIR